ncbi:MAG: HEAT repeat domain-containing protein, partial [Gemmataceae bacterium]
MFQTSSIILMPLFILPASPAGSAPSAIVSSVHRQNKPANPAPAVPARPPLKVMIQARPAVPIPAQVPAAAQAGQVIIQPIAQVQVINAPAAPASQSGSSRPSRAGGPADESILLASRVGTTPEALIEFFRQRTPPHPPREQIEELVNKLSSADPGDRDRAQARLVSIGQAAVPMLRTAANNVDKVDASSRARTCLQQIEGEAGANLVSNAARLLATLKTREAAGVLIGYLPFAEDENTFQEIEAALVAVGVREGKPDATLIQALKDPLAIRRGAAAHVICQAGGSGFQSEVRPLLKDPSASVRLRAALGLASTYDPEAIPVLIDLLAVLTSTSRQQAEEYLTQLAGDWSVSGPKGEDPFSRQLRKDVWSAWWKNTDGRRLLEEFRGRQIADDDLLKIQALVAKLADEDGSKREAAVQELTSLGKVAGPLLRRAVQDNDARIAPLAARCLQMLDRNVQPPMPTAAYRLLAFRNPPGAMEELLASLPLCESAEASEQVVEILSMLMSGAGKSPEFLIKALDDRIPARRAAAAGILSRSRLAENRDVVRKLLRDRDPQVRLRTAQTLTAQGDREAVPVLIGLLKELPLEQVWEIEDYLGQLAGDKAPSAIVSVDPASRARAHDAWSAWWKEAGSAVDLAKVESSRKDSGLYVVIENWNPALGKGRILEVDASGKPRWEIKDLQWPNDAQVLRNGNVLVIEQQNRVSERDRTGKVVGFDRNF